MKVVWIISFVMLLGFSHAQQIPTRGENVHSMVTFGNQAKTSYGDDDFSQVIFVSIPENYTSRFFIRIFDPEISGEMDEIYGENTTITRYEFFGGDSVFTHPDAQSHDPVGNYKSGVLLREKQFGSEGEYDGKWYTMGPFNPIEGEYVEHLKAYIFKLVVEGIEGDDGNLYRVFLSSEKDKNYALEGANLFTYEYTIRLISKKGEIAHLYPFIDDNVRSIKLYNFDFDSDGEIRVYSVSKNGHLGAKSGDDEWQVSQHAVDEEERGTSLNLQIVKKGAWNNDMTFYVTNQYDEFLPFYSIPIGGIPKYRYNVSIRYKGK